MSSGGITSSGLVAEICVAIAVATAPWLLVGVGLLFRRSPMGDLTAADAGDVRTEAIAIASLSLTLAGLTFAAIAFLATAADDGFAQGRQTPLGFFILALLMYAVSMILAKWIHGWTVFSTERARDGGTVLLLIGIGFLLFDFPGTEVWAVLGAASMALGLVLFVADLRSVWSLVWSAERRGGS